MVEELENFTILNMKNRTLVHFNPAWSAPVVVLQYRSNDADRQSRNLSAPAQILVPRFLLHEREHVVQRGLQNDDGVVRHAAPSKVQDHAHQVQPDVLVLARRVVHRLSGALERLRRVAGYPPVDRGPVVRVPVGRVREDPRSGQGPVDFGNVVPAQESGQLQIGVDLYGPRCQEIQSYALSEPRKTRR